MILIILFTAVVLLSIIYGLPFLIKKNEQQKLNKYCRRHGILVFSYDDGPGSRLTVKLLKLLKEKNVKATFFFLGLRVAKHIDLVYDVKHAGHEIGCHGQNHINYWKVFPTRAFNDIAKGQQSLSFLNQKTIFRPPYGKLTVFEWIMLKHQRVKLGWWTYVTGDTHRELKSFSDIVKDVERKNGGVILMHDFDRSPDRVINEDFVIVVTEQLIELAARRKWKIMTLGDLNGLISAKS